VLNGAVAHLGKIGDRLTIMSYAVVDAAEAAAWHPRVVVLGEGNSIVTERGI
jgi:aspartate 1-decarboxylase